jgi:hypothetical protein
MKLALRDRFRLFFWGAVRETALIAQYAREYRIYRDNLNAIIERLVVSPDMEALKEGVCYVLVDAAFVQRVVERVYGPDHPWAISYREQVEACRQAAEGANNLKVVN